MPRRYQPSQIAAIVIIGILAAIVILILFHRPWL
jgi:hypothetical protein